MAQYIVNLAELSQYFNSITDVGFTQHISNSGGSGAFHRFIGAYVRSSGGSYVLGYDDLNGSQDVEVMARFMVHGSSRWERRGILYARYGGTSEATTVGWNVSLLPVAGVASVVISQDSVGAMWHMPFDWSHDTWYWAKLRVNGNNVQMKIWPNGQNEPTSWTADFINATPPIAVPYSGLGTFTSDGGITYDFFSAGTDGDFAPSSQPKSSQFGQARIEKVWSTSQSGTSEISRAIPSETPLGIYGGGYGGVGGYGSAYGHGITPAFTIQSVSQIGQARIEKPIGLSSKGRARIERVSSVQIQGDARIERVEQASQSGNASVERIFTTSTSGRSRIEQVNSTAQLGLAAIESYYFTAQVTQTGIARIKKSISISQSGRANITRIKQRVQRGRSFIEWQRSVDQGGISRLERIRSATQGGIASIEKSKFKEQLGNARVERIELIAVHGLARISRSESLTQSGRSKIIRVDQAQQVGNARIQRTESLVVYGIARISNPTPDKRPQRWEDEDTRRAKSWGEDSKLPASWGEESTKYESSWGEDDKTPQDWSDSGDKRPADWERIYYE